jgi:hypothetical protein
MKYSGTFIPGPSPLCPLLLTQQGHPPPPAKTFLSLLSPPPGPTLGQLNSCSPLGDSLSLVWHVKLMEVVVIVGMRRARQIGTYIEHEEVK